MAPWWGLGPLPIGQGGPSQNPRSPRAWPTRPDGAGAGRDSLVSHLQALTPQTRGFCCFSVDRNPAAERGCLNIR